MKHVTDQRKRKRWLAPLALGLAVYLAIHPASLNVVQAGEDEVSAFWAAADAFWGDDGKEPAFWETMNALWGTYDEEGNLVTPGTMQAYQDAMDAYDAAEDDARNTDAIDAARPEVLRSIEEYYEAYDAVTVAFNDVTVKFNALSDEEKTEKDENNSEAMSLQEVYDDISEIYNGDGTDENWGIKGSYIDVEKWNYWDNEFQYQNACVSYDSACEALWGNDEKDITGATKEYEEAVNTNGDVDAALEKMQECVSGVKDAKARIDQFYDAMEKVYEKIPEDKNGEFKDSYEDVKKWKEERDLGYNETLSRLNIWEYTNSIDAYWKARDVFWESSNNFLGNKQENIAGAHPTYMAALESEAENLDALYEEALAARAAVEEAYKTMTEKYQAENAAYEALTEDDQQMPYGDDGKVVADLPKEVENDYTTGWVPETYNLIHECEIPAPPQKEEPTPTTPPQEDPVATPTPVPTTSPQDAPTATPTPAPTTPPQDVPTATPTPAPATPSGQGSAAQSAPKQEPLADWNVVYKDVDNSVASGETQNVYAQAGTQFQVNGNILDKLAGSKTALFLNTGTGLSFSISGVDVPQGVPSLKVAMAAADGIPEAAKQSVLTGAAFSRTFAMEDKGVYPIKMDVHLNVGKENAGKNAYLYYYDETTGTLKLAGAFKATEAGQVMFAINHGDEYIVVVADNAAVQLGRYTVVSGDSLSRIAAKNGMSLKQLLKVNPGIKNPNRIRPGDVINLD